MTSVGNHGRPVLLTGTSNVSLAKKVGVCLGGAHVFQVASKFSNGENKISIPESVRDCDVFVIQSTANPDPDVNLMQLCTILQATKLASARRITAVIPCFGYARQDRKSTSREPITARLCAQFIEVAGADRILTLDLHADQIQGFFSKPVDQLSAENLFVRFIEQKFQLDAAERESAAVQIVVVSPDAGGVKRTRNVATKLGVDLAIIHKHRPKPNEVDAKSLKLVGHVEGQICVLVDDMVDTAGTLCHAAVLLKENGAARVYALATHGILSGPAFHRLMHCEALDQLVVTDSIDVAQQKSNMSAESPLDNVWNPDKIKVLSIGGLIAESIRRTHNGESLSGLFRMESSGAVTGNLKFYSL